MSIMKYTRKYVLYSLIALVILCGVGAIVYSQIQRGMEVPDESFGLYSGQESNTSDLSSQNMWDKITARLKKNPKATTGHSDHHDIDHSHVDGSPDQDRALPRSLEKRLDKVRIDHGGQYNHDYLTNPNYYRDVYEAVSNGRDMETTIQLLKEYGIYTDVVLEHMDSYEAFKYVQNCSIDVDVKKESAIKYAKRVVNEAPSSAEALDAWLYLERVTSDPQEDENYLRAALEYHPNSIAVLNGLGTLLVHEKPEHAVRYFKKVKGLDSKQGDWDLGIAYQRLGDYKTAWVHLKRSLALYPNSTMRVFKQMHLDAIEIGEPALSPVQRDSIPDLTGQSADVPSQNPVDVPSAPNFDVFVDDFVMPEEVPASMPPPERLSAEELARQESEHQAYLDMLDEQEAFSKRLETDAMFREAYFEEVEKFITWAESIMNDVPVETNNFLSKEMERHLLGKQTTFDPDRIKRGFEFINKYGQDEGLKRLHQKDPDLAKQVTQLLNEKRVPPRHPRGQ